MRIDNLYRIENVSTQRVLRITSDEEERTRQGYEMHTTIQFAESDNQLRVLSAEVMDQGSKLLTLKYAPAATVWRINLGWRRRKEKSIHGFNIDTATGFWSRDAQAPVDENDAAEKEERCIQRITPYVEDRRNILILQPAEPLEETVITTLQAALKRGMEEEFQVEESELMAEPLPHRDKRNAILFYEAAEGGAGILTRLVSDKNALARVADRALRICHYTPSPTWQDSTVENSNVNDNCEAGCYRCLLSYYNQPDHELLDRRNHEVFHILVALTTASVQSGSGGKSREEQLEHLIRLSNSSLEKEWLDHFRHNNYRLPDEAQFTLEKFKTRPDFIYREQQAVIYIDGPHHHQPAQQKIDADLTEKLEEAGLLVIRFPEDKKKWPEIFAMYPEVFGRLER